ncbi:hypothetical protein M196_gp41 [Halorubrum tailed virus 4]|uniref:Uncharacterized protein n=1 Tax=Halorubrum tailed virus 4 TaxID=1273752 RepID=R4TLU7_9CAUD|nr:hypothetical protein M196_gp41 [Halorubrum tailed virus 4]AGM11133.1 hypothetical protein HRTV4_41 [Halorubrum tailed virus 4]
MSQTKTVQTAYGDVDVEVVECDSCGNTIGKDEAREFTLGNREGHACEHCVGEGPISFPSKYGSFDMGESSDGRFLNFLVWAPVVIPLLMMFGPFENDDNDLMRGAMWVAWTITIYALVIGYVALVAL